MDPQNSPEEALKSLISDYVMATWLSKKEVMRVYVPVMNLMKMGWKLIQKKNLCTKCWGDGQWRCEKVECVMGTQAEECSACHNKEDRRVYDVCHYCGGFGDLSEMLTTQKIILDDEITR